MPAKVSFTLDGRALEVPEGTLVLEAARSAGIEIPHYCYHPALGNPGVCRLCMVEVEGAPKLQVSCRLEARQGMVVRSASPAARSAQASSLEFHLVNHPLDCPVCDQAGECWLQDYYMRFGLYKSEVREDKQHKPKRLDIGPRIVLDSERCILCTRCTRFLDEVTQTHELGIFQRGGRSELLPYPGRVVDNPYAGNIVDLCPVGALTDKEFRFQVRAWYLDRTPTLCTGCSRGCSIELHTSTKRPWHAEGRRAVRIVPRHNPEVNGWWICDEGRYSWKPVDAPSRLKAASVMEKGRLAGMPWREAARRAALELSALCRERGPQGLAVVLSASLSNEDLFAARELFVRALQAGRMLVAPGPDQLGEEDELLRRREKVPNLSGARALGFGSPIRESSWEEILKAVSKGEVWGLYAVDRDPVEVWGVEAEPALAGLAWSAYQGPQARRFTARSRWSLPSCSWAEKDASYANFEGLVQRGRAALAPLGDSQPDWAIWGEMLRALGADFPHGSAASIFSTLAASEPAFHGLSWEGLDKTGVRLARTEAAPA